MMVRVLDRKGFTLLEVLGAMLILALGLLSLLRLQTAAVKGNSYANQMSQATSLAQQKMEDLLAQDYAALSCGAPDTEGIYTVQCDPAISEDTAARTKTINVKVSWRDSKNVDHNVVLRSIKAETF